jgi:hypothetical protein
VEDAGDGSYHSALNLGQIHALEIHGRALARNRAARQCAVYLNAANLGRKAAGNKLNFLLLLDLAGCQRAGYDSSEAANAESAVDREAKEPVGGTQRDRGGHVMNRLFQSVDPFAGLCAYREDGGVFEERSLHGFRDFIPNQLDHFRIHHVDLIDDDDAGPDAEQAADIEMLPRLGHDRLVRSDYEEDKIDAAHSCQHVFDKLFVPRNIDKSDLDIAKIEMCKSQVDGDAAELFLLQAVGIHSG